jgi:hypothetical protein
VFDRWESWDGGSTTVDAGCVTVVNAPSQHAGEMSAERPPSGRVRVQIDHRL